MKLFFETIESLTNKKKEIERRLKALETGKASASDGYKDLLQIELEGVKSHLQVLYDAQEKEFCERFCQDPEMESQKEKDETLRKAAINRVADIIQNAIALEPADDEYIIEEEYEVFKSMKELDEDIRDYHRVLENNLSSEEERDERE